MIHRIAIVLGVLAVLCGTIGSEFSSTYARPVADSALALLCPANLTDHPTQFVSASGITTVVACSTAVQSGSQLELVIRTHKLAQVQAQLLFLDKTTAPTSGPLVTYADKRGIAHVRLSVQYNPLASYADATLNVAVLLTGHTDTVSGSVTIAQATSLASTVLRARPGYRASWCSTEHPNDHALCSIRNNSTVIVQLTTDPGAQVALTLTYPDGTSVPGPANEMTGTALTSQGGVYRCRLPVVYQAKALRPGDVITIQAQVSVGGHTQQPALQLSLLAR